MATNDNSNFTEDENEHEISSSSSSKRVITLSSDDEDNNTNKIIKKQRSSLTSKIKPLQLINKQPIICNTRQTCLSVIRSNSNTNGNEESKWNLKTVVTSSTENSSKLKKKRLTQTVN